MPYTVFVQDGECIDYTPAADVDAGDVVLQGDLIGIAKLDISAGTLGALTVTGVFDFAKATRVGTAVTAGANVYSDDAADQATTTATGNKLIGKSVKAASDADVTVRVRLNP